VVFAPSDPGQPFGFMMLQHVVPQLMEENLLQHESPECIGRPIHQGCAGLRDLADPSPSSFESVYVFLREPSMQRPRRQSLFEKEDSAGGLVATEYQ
jgi:hypothetical protein